LEQMIRTVRIRFCINKLKAVGLKSIVG